MFLVIPKKEKKKKKKQRGGGGGERGNMFPEVLGFRSFVLLRSFARQVLCVSFINFLAVLLSFTQTHKHTSSVDIHKYSLKMYPNPIATNPNSNSNPNPKPLTPSGEHIDFPDHNAA